MTTSITADRRSQRRYPVLWSASLCTGSALSPHVLTCRIQNVSISGLHVLAETKLAPDTKVTLRIDRVGVFHGRVAWSNDDGIGIAFDDNPDRVAELIRDRM